MPKRITQSATLLFCLMFVSQSLFAVADRTHLFDSGHDHQHVKYGHTEVSSEGCDHFTAVGIRQTLVVYQHHIPCEDDSHHCHIDHIEIGPMAVIGSVDYDTDVFKLLELPQLIDVVLYERTPINSVMMDVVDPPVKLFNALCLKSVVLIV